MKLVITGGGTGGHIFGGIAIAQEFLSQSKGNEVLFIGASSGLETTLVPRAGYRLEILNLGKLVGQTWFTRLLTLMQIPLAIFKCIKLLHQFQPHMVVGVGGYASGPCILAAHILGIPTGVLEQNSIMGFTNRITAKLADQVFLTFDEIPRGISAHKCKITGNPTRVNFSPSSVKADRPFVVFAFGGSQGATGINKLMTEAAKILVSKKSNNISFQFIHQTGERDFDWVQKTYAEIGFTAEVHKFIHDMPAMYNRASLVICRAGSSTISELGATQNAAIFIPFPFAAGNHQEINARAVEKTGAARVLIQKTSTGADLAQLLDELSLHPEELAKMRQKMASFHKPQAARQIVEFMKIRALGLG